MAIRRLYDSLAVQFEVDLQTYLCGIRKALNSGLDPHWAVLLSRRPSLAKYSLFYYPQSEVTR